MKRLSIVQRMKVNSQQRKGHLKQTSSRGAYFKVLGHCKSKHLPEVCVVPFATSMPPGNFSRARPPVPLGNFYLLTPPPHPLGISIDHPSGGYFLEPHIFIFQYLCKPSIRSLEKKNVPTPGFSNQRPFNPKSLDYRA